MCATILIAIFTIGITHAVVGAAWKRRVKKLEGEANPTAEKVKTASLQSLPINPPRSSSSTHNPEPSVRNRPSRDNVVSPVLEQQVNEPWSRLVTPEMALDAWTNSLNSVKQAANDFGNSLAQFQLLKWKEEGRLVGDLRYGDKDIVEMAALDDNPDPEALFRLIQDPEQQDSIEVYKEELSNIRTPLGKYYLALGIGIDSIAGRNLLNEAAGLGCYEAMRDLDLNLGQGFSTDLLKIAARAGSSAALFHLGSQKLEEFEANHDDQAKSEAYLYFSNAAFLGNRPAIYQMIAHCEERGEAEELAKWKDYNRALYGE